METKRGKVTAVTMKKEGTGQYGKYYIFTVVFDNGDSGDYLGKSNPQTAFKVGEESEYTKETVQNGNYTNVKIKQVQQNGGGFKPQNPVYANKRTALECASRVGGNIETILSNATKFDAWLNDAPKQNPVLKPEPQPIDDIPEWLKD